MPIDRIAASLAIPAMLFQLRALIGDDPTHLLGVYAFNAALYAITIAYLLRYVFQRDVMTADKLYGAAAGYLMLGVLWAFLYSIVEHVQPSAFAVMGTPAPTTFTDLLYFSITVLTSTGFGDIVPVARWARALTILEELTGALFLAILIARLAGVYPPARDRGEARSFRAWSAPNTRTETASPTHAESSVASADDDESIEPRVSAVDETRNA